MPIYEFRCTACDTVFARLQPVSAAQTGIPCPKCESDATERLVSTFAAGSSSPKAQPACPSRPSCGASGGG